MVDFIRVHFVRYVRKRVWGGTSEDSEAGWHAQRNGDVRDIG